VTHSIKPVLSPPKYSGQARSMDSGQARFDLTRIPVARALLVNRWPQFLVRLIALIGFLFAIAAGLAGTPVGNRNFSIVFVWIAWWALLILVAVPLAGRGWCTICPIPMPGEWLQNRALLGPRGSKPALGLGRKWPKGLRNIWLQNGAFALLALFSAVVLTQPGVTAIILAAFLFIAIGTSLIFERRAFCRYLCPVGGFIGLYSQAAPLEVRVRDTSICATHTIKTCYTGSEDGYGCPWGIFPGGLVKNTTCGTCLECLRTCPLDNIAINIRPAGADLSQPRGRKLDEAFKAFIMLGSALVYSAVLLGPWGQLKTAAYGIGSLPWLLYVLAFLALVFVFLPGLFYLATWAGRALAPDRYNSRRSFTAYAYALVPLGLAAWIAFSLSFVFANASYILPVLSDPLGWGWDLLGTAGYNWTPTLTQLVPALQILVLVVGLAWAGVTARRIAQESDHSVAWRQALPINLFCLLVTVGFLWLFVG
jgi:polyferredoxin